MNDFMAYATTILAAFHSYLRGFDYFCRNLRSILG